MKLILISPETPRNDEVSVYKSIQHHPKLEHIHYRRKENHSDVIWGDLKDFKNKLVCSDTSIPPFDCKGLHGKKSIFSTSTHSIRDALNCSSLYCYISPLYPSITKFGYKNDELLIGIKSLASIPENWVALGGINIEHITDLKALGFKTIAVLGAVWNNENPKKTVLQLLDAL